jgi:spore maturation protein CgeB
MRADTLSKLAPESNWERIDTDEGFRSACRLWKSIAFRLKAGPLVRQINRRIIEETKGKQYDLVWVDKGVYLWPRTIDQLGSIGKYLVHFTPDTAFHANRSRHFFLSVPKYDLLVTTKSFELGKYQELADNNQIYLATQAFNSEIHRPPRNLTMKNQSAVFIGLCEPDREACIDALLKKAIPVRLGGQGWDRFLKRHKSSPHLHFIGKNVFGDHYVDELAAASVGLGLLSKKFPELHTTRTFEIPACGTMLATERTADTSRFFNEDEVLFFSDYYSLAEKLAEMFKQPNAIQRIALKGRQRIVNGGYDYRSVLSDVLRYLPRRETTG